MGGEAAAKPLKKQWADGPYKLLQTPRARKGEFDLKDEHPASAAATEMCLVHNTIIRGLNALWLQAPNISKPLDVHDFMIFAYAWSKLIHMHHSNEEEFFFGWIEDDIGVKHGEVLGENVEQHHAFQAGLKGFDEFVEAVREGKTVYDGMKVRSLLDSFCDGEKGLYKHLKEEIATFEALEKYDMIDWKRWNERVQKEAVGKADLEYEIPLIITNMDVNCEDGINMPTWPPFPWYACLVFRWVHIPKHPGAWRFSACDTKGKPKELPFV